VLLQTQAVESETVNLEAQMKSLHAEVPEAAEMPEVAESKRQTGSALLEALCNGKLDELIDQDGHLQAQAPVSRSAVAIATGEITSALPATEEPVLSRRNKRIATKVISVLQTESRPITAQEESLCPNVETFAVVKRFASSWRREAADPEADPRMKEIGWGRFHTHLGKVAPYMWLPKTAQLDAAMAQRVMKQFQLKRPNLVLTFESGHAHPLHLLPEDKELTESFNLADAAKEKKLNKKFRRQQTVDGCSMESKEFCNETIKTRANFDALLVVLNDAQTAFSKEQKKEKNSKAKMDMLNKTVKRLVYRVIQTILAITAEQNVWIVIQRKPTGIHVLLEEALLKFKSTKAVVLVIDCPFKKLYTSLDTKKNYMVLDSLNKDGEQFTKLEQTLDTIIKDVTSLNAKMMTMKMSLEEKDPTVWNLCDFEDDRRDEDKNVQFWKEDNMKKGWTHKSARDPGSEGNRWSQYIFRSGTHYIFFDSERESDLDVSLFGAKGSVFLGGGRETKEQIMLAVRLGQPCVMIDHTGRATQQLMALHKELISYYRQEPSSRMGKESLFRRLITVSGVDKDNSEVNFADVIAMDSMYHQRCNIIQETCVAIDPLDKETNEAGIMNKVAECFAASFRISTTVAYEASSRRAVANAWMMHAQLSTSCASQKFLYEVTMKAVLIMSLITLFASLIIMEILQPEGLMTTLNAKKGGPVYEVCTYVVIILPAVSGMVTTISSQMRFREVWGTMTTAACHIESEIFKFRVRVKDYAVVGCGGFSSDRSAREKHARDLFTTNVNLIFNGYLSSIQRASLKTSVDFVDLPSYAEFAGVFSTQAGGRFAWLDFVRGPSRAKASKHRACDKQLERANAKAPDTTHCLRRQESVQIERLIEKRNDKTATEELTDNEEDPRRTQHIIAETLASRQLGVLSAQEYYFERLMPTLDHFTSMGGRLKRYVTIGEVAIAICAMAASVAGAVTGKGPLKSMSSLVPVFMTLAATCTTLMQQQALYARLTAVNTAVRELTKLDLMWNASSPLEQCSQETTANMVAETERLRINVVTAWTNITQDKSSSKKKGADKKKASKSKDKEDSAV